MCGCKVEREEVRGYTCEQRVFDSRAENLEIDMLQLVVWKKVALRRFWEY